MLYATLNIYPTWVGYFHILCQTLFAQAFISRLEVTSVVLRGSGIIHRVQYVSSTLLVMMDFHNELACALVFGNGFYTCDLMNTY